MVDNGPFPIKKVDKDAIVLINISPNKTVLFFKEATLNSYY